jgi:hypothetical protein
VAPLSGSVSSAYWRIQLAHPNAAAALGAPSSSACAVISSTDAIMAAAASRDQPAADDRYRDRRGTSGAKSDKADAHILADMVRIDFRQSRPVAGDSAGPRHAARRGCLPAAHRHPGLPARRQCRRACGHPRHPAAPHARWPVLPAGQRHRRLAPARSNRAPSRRRVHRPLSCRPKTGPAHPLLHRHRTGRPVRQRITRPSSRRGCRRPTVTRPVVAVGSDLAQGRPR